MKIILLSGGSGKRLWPLSNDSRSKQFLKVLKNEENQLESMVQRVWRQLKTVALADHTYITTGRSQVDMLQNQLGCSTPIIIEPERRDTFPAIALSAVYLYSMEGISLEETIAVLPVDPFVDDRFFQSVLSLDHLLQESDADLALIGVEPAYPSEKYGYIVLTEDEPTALGYRKVSCFNEKPTEQKAKELIQQHALWNCGVFAFKLGYLVSLLVEKGFPIHYEDMSKQYDRLPKISFDYEIVEKADNIVAISYDGFWKDLGTWNTLTEEMDNKQVGKGILSDDSINTHLINELDIPVTVLGLPNVIVAASPDGILVADKEASPRIKDLIKDFDQRLMYEERKWGWYRVLDFSASIEGNEILTRRICIHDGKNLSYHVHYKRKEVWTVVSGQGEVILDGTITLVKPGDVIEVLPNIKHAVRAHTDLEMIEIQSGSELVEEDIHRLILGWPEIEELTK